MSYSSHGPYRSRLFNFVNRQSRRLLEQGGRAIRNLKVAATWGTQILLYPIYLLTQAGLSARHQVGGEAKSKSATLNSAKESSLSQPEINVPAADTPIQAILKEVTILPLLELGASFDEKNITPQPPSLRGKGEKDRQGEKDREDEGDEELRILSRGKSGEKEVTEINGLSWTENIYRSSLRGIKLLASSFNQLRYGRLTEDVKANKITAQPNSFWSPGFLSFVRGDASISQSEINGGLIQDSQKLTNNDKPELDSQAWVIQGVASLLETRSLVLVTVGNEILDILTPEQQKKLSAKITYQLANFFRQWRMALKSPSPKVPRKLTGMAKPNLLPPLKRFWELMGWEQTSQIAIAINLFGESTLVTTSNSPNLIQPLTPTPAPSVKSILAQILPEKALLFLESKAITLDAYTLAAESQTLVQELKTTIAARGQSPIALRAGRKNSIEKGENQLIPPENSTPITETAQIHPFWLAELIYRAIDYFFGKSSNLLETEAVEEGENRIVGINDNVKLRSRSGREVPSSLPPSEIDTNPWLTWDDLFGNSNTTAQNPTLSQATPLILKGDKAKNPPQLREGLDSKIYQTLKNSPWELWHRYLKPKGNITVRDSSRQEAKLEIPVNTDSDSFTRLRHRQNQLNPIQKLAVSMKKQFMAEAPSGQKNLPNAIAVSSNPSISSNIGVSPNIGNLKDWAEPKENPQPTPKSVKPASKSVKPGKNQQLSQTKNTVQTTLPTSNLALPIINENQNLKLKTQNSKVTPSPDWIETQATHTGYVKHPLELILGWLDMAIVWLEELCLKVLEWVQNLWHRR